MSVSRNKIFGIGLSKTGTSSLAQALQILGFQTKDNMGVTRYAKGDLSSMDMETVMAYDALTDTPIPSFFQELDRAFPGSKFILTVRERQGWLKSCAKQFNQRLATVRHPAQRELFDDLYGTNIFDEERFADGYERFVASVLDYFRDRPLDLLVMDIAAGDGWEKLCQFVGRPVPDAPFPKTNVTEIQWISIEKIAAVAEAAGLELMKRFQGTSAFESGIGTSQKARRSLARAMQAVLGTDAAETAARAAHKTLTEGLSRLNSGIALLSPNNALPAYNERRRWHHLWLVDPLDGKRAFADGRCDFSVNIALVEDGRPIFGVVHAPALRRTYYARNDRGAFKRTAGEKVVSLGPNKGVEGAGVEEVKGPTHLIDAVDAENSSIALALCGLLEAPLESAHVCGPAMEWKTAAAHAVLKAAQLDIGDSESSVEPVYNKSVMMTAPMTVRERHGA